MSSAALRILQDTCAIPTAPFVEDRVAAYIEAFARKRNLRLTRDAHGNLLVSLGAPPKKGQRRLVLAAHMDHPGFVATDMVGKGELKADFRGGVLADYVLGARVRFFDGDDEIAGKVISIDGATEDRPYPTSAIIRVSRDVLPRSPGMFDLTPGRMLQTHFHSRVCDDLAGAASALSALDALSRLKGRKKLKVPFAVLFTRAEEVGFVGAIAAVLKPELLRKADDLLVAIETSAEQPYAPRGNGVILRIGDRTSIFNSSFSAYIHDLCQAQAKRDATFKFQRALMPGGTCESTVYDAYGYHAAAVCVPLGNYHNMDRKKKRIATEYIHLGDYLNMVRLFILLAKSIPSYEPGHIALKQRLEKRFKEHEALLR